MPGTLNLRAPTAAVAAVAAIAALVACWSAATASAAPPYDVKYTFDGALFAQGNAPDQPSPGANDFGCVPSEDHPNPVVLAHGLLANQTVNWNTIAPMLANDGYCVFSLTYGTKDNIKSPIYQPGGLQKMQRSALQLREFVNGVLDATGAEKVDIVGHSEGSIMPNYYVRFLGGNQVVDKYVGLTTLWEGTNAAGLSDLYITGSMLGISPGIKSVLDTGCESCTQFLANSDFIDEMHEGGGVADPAVTYTNIVTKYDELVQPYTSGYMPAGPNVTNITLQDTCSNDYAEHLTVAYDPNVAILIGNALSPEHARPRTCDLVLPGIGSLTAKGPAPLDSNGDGTPDYADTGHSF